MTAITYDLGVDIDDVIHPWFLTAHAACEAAGITNGVTPKTWRMHEEYECPLDTWVDVLERATGDGSLYGAAPIPGAVEALRRLLFEGHRIHLITARGTGDWNTVSQRVAIRQQTLAWIEEFAVPNDSLIYSHTKSKVAQELGLDFFVDDSVANFQDLEINAPGTQTYLMTAPHNADFYTPFRISSMDEFADIVMESAEKGTVKL